MKKINNIIFDLGNVIFNYNPAYIIENIVPKSKNKQLYLDHLFNAECWQQLDRGDVSQATVIKQLTNKYSLNKNESAEIHQLLNSFTKHLIINSDMKDLFETCCQHYNVFILSNFQTEGFEVLRQDNPFLNKAKGRVISAHVMMKKPELGIYHYLLSQFCITPTESVFIDDLKENIIAAKKMQINGIHFKSFSQTKKELNHFGIKL
tara:strand:+ start:1308 stop:1925 length:618 start_codon:yes stop_codon:yes gene_type:complete